MPRKSAASTAAAGDVAPVSPSGKNADTSILSATGEPTTPQQKEKPSRQSKGNDDGVGIDDLLLPRTLTSRLARGILPANTSIQKDALLALTKSATVFISYLAAHANEQTNKKTIGPQDVINALKEIELASVMEIGKVAPDGGLGGRLERELEAYEGVVRGKRRGYREKVKGRESGVGAEGEGEGEGEERGEPAEKRVKLGDGDAMNLDDGSKGKEPDVVGPSQAYLDSIPFPGETHAHVNGNGNGLGHAHATDEALDAEEDEQDTYEDDQDATESDGQPEEEEEDEDEARDDDDDIDGYGPDEQLRRDMIMNGDEGGTEDESD